MKKSSRRNMVVFFVEDFGRSATFKDDDVGAL